MKFAVGTLIFCLIFCINSGFARDKDPEGPDLSAIRILDLYTAQKLALQGNPDIIAARSRVEQARARVKQAVAAWWPGVDLVAGYRNERTSNTVYQANQALASLYGASVEQSGDSFSMKAQATWLLFDGFARKFQQKQAQYSEQASNAGVENTERILTQSVAEAFLNAQLAQTNVDIAQADKDFYQRQLEDAQNRYDVGAGTWGDILNIKVQLNSAKTSHMVNQREFEAAGYGLAALIGIPDARLPEKLRLQALDQDTITRHPKESVDQLIKDALQARPDLQQLELQIRQAEAGTELAKAPFYPSVQLEGALTGARDDDPAFGEDDYGNYIGLSLAWNVFSGGADKARLLESRQAKRESLYTYYSLRNQIASEIRQDLALLEAAEEQVRLQRETLGLVEENRNLAKEEYDAGESSLVRLNEAQRDLTTTYGRLVQALVAWHRAKQNLDSALGRNLLKLSSQKELK